MSFYVEHPREYALTLVETDEQAEREGWAPENRPSPENVALAKAFLSRS